MAAQGIPGLARIRLRRNGPMRSERLKSRNAPRRDASFAERQPARVPVEEPAPIVGEVPDELLDAIRAGSREAPGHRTAELEPTRAASANWNDGSLGCPRPDQVYTQAITPGYHVVFEVGGNVLRLPREAKRVLHALRTAGKTRPDSLLNKKQAPPDGGPACLSDRVSGLFAYFALSNSASVAWVAPPRAPNPRSPLVISIKPSSSVLPGNRPKSTTVVVPTPDAGISDGMPKYRSPSGVIVKPSTRSPGPP
jgi:hypothetical protein